MYDSCHLPLIAEAFLQFSGAAHTNLTADHFWHFLESFPSLDFKGSFTEQFLQCIWKHSQLENIKSSFTSNSEVLRISKCNNKSRFAI